MTAEIVIMNRSGVALAADSAVTVGDGVKVYNSVNKIFTLSKHHPVGIMIYGNAEYMSVPWETVIKLYREQLGRRSFGTVQRYANDFMRYLDREFEISKDDENDRIIQIWIGYFEILNSHLHRVLLEAQSTMTLSDATVKNFFLGVIGEHIKVLRTRPPLRQYSSVTATSIARRFTTQFENAKEYAFPGRKFTRAIDNALRTYASLVLTRSVFGDSDSGLVITGFGEDEIFPGMFATMCSGKLLGKLRVIPNAEYVRITSRHDERVGIYAFAQKEMVGRFMDGIDPGYSDFISAGVSQLVERITEELIKRHARGGKAAIARRIAAGKVAAQKMAEHFEKEAEMFRYQSYVEPMLDVVSILPKEELAELAGALVNITSLKRKFAMDAETVGGPTDVAVISKGDGFIWIRRKHYFRPELNQAFLRNYLSTNKDEGASS